MPSVSPVKFVEHGDEEQLVELIRVVGLYKYIVIVSKPASESEDVTFAEMYVCGRLLLLTGVGDVKFMVGGVVSIVKLHISETFVYSPSEQFTLTLCKPSPRDWFILICVGVAFCAEDVLYPGCPSTHNSQESVEFSLSYAVKFTIGCDSFV